MADTHHAHPPITRAQPDTEQHGRADTHENDNATCGPTTTCRMAQHLNFDGYGSAETDSHAGWRALLAAEGKLREPGLDTDPTRRP